MLYRRIWCLGFVNIALNSPRAIRVPSPEDQVFTYVLSAMPVLQGLHLCLKDPSFHRPVPCHLHLRLYKDEIVSEALEERAYPRLKCSPPTQGGLAGWEPDDILGQEFDVTVCIAAIYCRNPLLSLIRYRLEIIGHVDTREGEGVVRLAPFLCTAV